MAIAPPPALGDVERGLGEKRAQESPWQRTGPPVSYAHAPSTTPLTGLTIGEFMRQSLPRYGANEALVSVPQSRRLTYGQLDREIARLARGLIALGVAKGDRVGIWSTNNVEWLLLQFATARIGAVLVNINPANRAAELDHALRQARVQVLFTIPRFRGSEYVQTIIDLCPELAQADPANLGLKHFPDLRRLVVYDAVAGGGVARPARGFLTWPEVIAAGEAVPESGLAAREAVLDADDPINIQFTSGTTGLPKGVLLTHHNVLNNGFFVGEALRLGPADRICVPVPFYHCFGMVVCNLAGVTHGSCLVIPSEYFDAGAALAAVERERCTVLHGVPTMFISELEHPAFKTTDLSTLRTGIMAGAPCPPELMRRVILEMGVRDLLIGYGQTEASPVTHVTRPDDPFERRIGTVGGSLPHQEAKVIDVETGRVLPAGLQGEVCVRGYQVMRGYYGQEADTRKSIDEARWLHTGDLGVMDEAGYVRITGRLKDMIKRGGECIFPAEVEAFYYSHPKIAQIAVFGIPDQFMGEEVGAWIQLHEGASGEPEEFREFARGKIAHFKVPRHVWIVDEFPTTVTGKVQKYRIREIVAGWLAGGKRTVG